MDKPSPPPSHEVLTEPNMTYDQVVEALLRAGYRPFDAHAIAKMRTDPYYSDVEGRPVEYYTNDDHDVGQMQAHDTHHADEDNGEWEGKTATGNPKA